MEFMIFVVCFVILATTAVANKDVSIESRIKRNVDTDVGTTSGHPIDKHYSVKEGEEYIFPHLIDIMKNEKMKSWYFGKSLVATKHLGETWIADKKNFSMTVKGDLIIRKMTLFFEGWYTLLVGNVSKTIYIALRADVIAINIRYREWIVDGVLHREWDGSYEMSTGKLIDCKIKMDLYLCSKRPEDPNEKPCEILYEAKIIMKPGVCKFNISYETSANTSTIVMYYVEFTSLDTFVTETFELTTNQTKGNGVTPFPTHLVTSMIPMTETTTTSLPMTATSRETGISANASVTMPPNPNPTSSKNTKWFVIVGIVVGCIAVIIIACLVCEYIRRHRRGNYQFDHDDGL